MAEFSREEKREAVERELKMRRRVYARMIAEGKMSQTKADTEIGVMEAIAADYAEPDLFTGQKP